MKKLLLFLLAFSFTSFLLLYPIPYTLYPTYAQSIDELSKQLQDKQAEIAKLEAHLQDARNQEKTLKSLPGLKTPLFYPWQTAWWCVAS